MVERANYVAPKDAKTCQLDLACVEDTERIGNALQMDAQIVLRVEECASDTMQSLRSNYAVIKDAQECAAGMEVQNYVAVKDAQIRLSEEVCVSGMAQNSHDAAVKDNTQTELEREECLQSEDWTECIECRINEQI